MLTMTKAIIKVLLPMGRASVYNALFMLIPRVYFHMPD